MPGSLPGALVLGAVLALLGGCRRRSDSTITLPAGDQPPAAKHDEPPVALDPNPPVDYPPALYQRRIGGTVLLRLFVSEQGRVVPESTRIQESSGYPAFDSAALSAVAKLRYSPALHNGAPAAVSFLQPFHFRHPAAGATVP